jgi:hypothetical protein
LEDEKIADEPMLQRPARHHFFYRNWLSQLPTFGIVIYLTQT